MPEKDKAVKIHASELSRNDLIYVTSNKGHSGWDTVWHVMQVGVSGDLTFLVCGKRDADSSIYANHPSDYFHLTLPSASLVDVVKGSEK